LGKDTLEFKTSTSTYEIDFKKMIQTTMKATTPEAKVGYRRPIRYVKRTIFEDGTEKIEVEIK
jgi:hypothetical protein